jgi:glycosyltransferase involved in cell wall biosynthesis
MRVAVVHEWFDVWGGSEQVALELARMFPQADVYALVDFMKPAERARFGPRAFRTSALQHLPGIHRYFRYAAVLLPELMERFDLRGYDLVLSSSHAVAKGVRSAPGQVHVCYCHAPARFAWSMESTYLAQGAGGSRLAEAMMKRAIARFRAWDRRAAARVSAFAANSRHIARGIAEVYGREARVVYPPVDVARFEAAGRGAAPGAHFVTVSRLVRYKRIDLVVEAFARRRDLALTIVGDGPERARLERMATPNVTFAGTQDDAGTVRAVAGARAFVFAALEDFGIAPVEAQAAGVPVIALRGGGTAETVEDLDRPAPSGVLYDAQEVGSLVEAIHRFEREAHRISASACRDNARRFAPSRFREGMRALIDETLAGASLPEPLPARP